MLFCRSRVRCSKQLLLRKMACSTGLSEHRNMSLIVSAIDKHSETLTDEESVQRVDEDLTKHVHLQRHKSALPVSTQRRHSAFSLLLLLLMSSDSRCWV